MGFPIRKFPDQSLFAAPRDLSQRTTSFIASQRQGIHRTPLRHLIALIANARRSVRLSPLPQALAPANGSKRPDSTRQSTGPTPEDRGRTGVGLFEKTSFASNASGNLSGQARLTTGLERRRDMRQTTNLAACVLSPRPIDRMRFLFTMSDSPRPSA